MNSMQLYEKPTTHFCLLTFSSSHNHLDRLSWKNKTTANASFLPYANNQAGYFKFQSLIS